MSAAKTPVMQQHAAAKRAHPDAIVLFRLGDFYEMFGEDATVGARLLDLTLTSRNKGKPDEIPMAGVPHHSAQAYIGKLLRAGYKVALCEQLADPSTVKGIVPREVVRVLTPGTVTHSDHLDSAVNNWLSAVELARGSAGIALLDLSTGELLAGSLPEDGPLIAELGRASPREILIGAGETASPEAASQLKAALRREPIFLGLAVRDDPPLPDDALTEHTRDVEHAGFEGAALGAAARVLRFAKACNPGGALPVRRITRWSPSRDMVLDATVQTHLEIVQSTSGDRRSTLLHTVDLTETALGARALRRRLLSPLLDLAQIRRRHDQIEVLLADGILRRDLRSALSTVTDLERILVRVEIGEATPRDLGALRDGLMGSARVLEVLERIGAASDREILGIDVAVDRVSDLAEVLDRALVERPPAQAKEGAVFRPGYDPELSELDVLRISGTERIVALETRLKAETDISTLKARYTRVFGWYLEVSRSHLSRVPSEWRRKQTIAGGERYTMQELDELADRIAGAEEQHRARELELLAWLSKQVVAAADRLIGLAERIASWDVAAALSEVAARYDYCRPEIDDGTTLTIVEGRHPVVERLGAPGGFVANDVRLDLEGERLWMVTGPNMAGKSTLLRQTALIALLAQAGSFVPARSARLGTVDRILSRVGASDNLAKGDSTFMVEMKETADILRNATRRSLVILDEIGRGTSTFDGLAIAWAVAEYLDEVVGCRALFATHYHELTALSESSPGVANYSVSAREVEGDIVFLHRLLPGAASRSYGVAVAKLAGLPEAVLARAQAILAGYEGETLSRPERPRTARRASRDAQLGLFEPIDAGAKAREEVLVTLKALDPNRLTPIEALGLIAQLKARL